MGGSGIGLSNLGSFRVPGIQIRQMGQRHPIRLSTVSWETASHLAVPMWDQVREESRRACFKAIKNTVHLSEDHGEMKMKSEDFSAGEKQCLCHEGNYGVFLSV